MSKKSSPQNQKISGSEPSYRNSSFHALPIEIRAFIAAIFTAFLMFLSAVVGYGWGHVQAQESALMKEMAQEQPSPLFKTGEAMLPLYERIGKVVSVNPENFLLQFVGETDAVNVLTNPQTVYLATSSAVGPATFDPSKEPASISRETIGTGDRVQVYASIDLRFVDSFVAEKIIKLP